MVFLAAMQALYSCPLALILFVFRETTFSSYYLFKESRARRLIICHAVKPGSWVHYSLQWRINAFVDRNKYLWIENDHVGNVYILVEWSDGRIVFITNYSSFLAFSRSKLFIAEAMFFNSTRNLSFVKSVLIMTLICTAIDNITYTIATDINKDYEPKSLETEDY